MRFGKFSFVGMCGAALQLVLTHFFVGACGLSAAAATPFAVELVLLHNFLWHERLTWRDRECRIPRLRAQRLCRFHAANGLVSIAGNTAIVWLLTKYAHLPPLASATAAIAVCAPLNYLLAGEWVFVSSAGRGSARPCRSEFQKAKRTRNCTLRGSVVVAVERPKDVAEMLIGLMPNVPPVGTWKIG